MRHSFRDRMERSVELFLIGIWGATLGHMGAPRPLSPLDRRVAFVMHGSFLRSRWGRTGYRSISLDAVKND